jgi:hypothetical protein
MLGEHEPSVDARARVAMLQLGVLRGRGLP